MNQNLRHRTDQQRPVAMRRLHDSGGKARQNYEMENCYQHADHYFRVMRGTGDVRRN
jgi:hypothetical protein